MAEEFWVAWQVVATIVVGGCFLLSGVAKIRDRSGTSDTFEALGVPTILNRTWVHLFYPWGELALGLGVLFTPKFAWLFAAAATLVNGTLTLLVWRVVSNGTAVECNCFGSPEPVTRRTLARNLIFLFFSATLLAGSFTGGSALIMAFPEQAPLAIAALLSAAIATVLTSLSKGGSYTPAGAETFENRELQVPDIQVLDETGNSLPIKSLTETEPLLLIHVKDSCGACEAVKAQFSHNELVADRVRIRFIERLPESGPDLSRPRLWDVDEAVSAGLGLNVLPSAVLIAPGGSIPANPVYGSKQIGQLVEGIKEAVSPAKSRRDQL